MAKLISITAIEAVQLKIPRAAIRSGEVYMDVVFVDSRRIKRQKRKFTLKFPPNAIRR